MRVTTLSLIDVLLPALVVRGSCPGVRRLPRCGSSRCMLQGVGRIGVPESHVGDTVHRTHRAGRLRHGDLLVDPRPGRSRTGRRSPAHSRSVRRPARPPSRTARSTAPASGREGCRGGVWVGLTQTIVTPATGSRAPGTVICREKAPVCPTTSLSVGGDDAPVRLPDPLLRLQLLRHSRVRRTPGSAIPPTRPTRPRTARSRSSSPLPTRRPVHPLLSYSAAQCGNLPG